MIQIVRIKAIRDGDWHDLPSKYAVNGPSNERQLFRTKRDALHYKALRRKSASQQEAINRYSRG